MSNEARTAVLNASQAKRSAHTLLLALSGAADPTGHATVSLDWLHGESQLSRRTIQYGLHQLEASGELRVRRAVGRKNLSCYTITVGGLHDDASEKRCKLCTFSPDADAEKVQTAAEKVQTITSPDAEKVQTAAQKVQNPPTLAVKGATVAPFIETPEGKGANFAPFAPEKVQTDAAEKVQTDPPRRGSDLNPGTPSRDEETGDEEDASFVSSKLSEVDQLRRNTSARRRRQPRPATPELAAVTALWQTLGFGPVSMKGAGELRGLIAEYGQPLVEEALQRAASQQVDHPRAWITHTLPGLRNQRQRSGNPALPNGHGPAPPGNGQAPAYQRAYVVTLADVTEPAVRGHLP